MAAPQFQLARLMRSHVSPDIAGGTNATGQLLQRSFAKDLESHGDDRKNEEVSKYTFLTR